VRVLLIHHAFASLNEGGGTRHYELARYCAQKGHEFIVVASDVSHLSGERLVTERGLSAERDSDGVRILRPHTPRTVHRSFVWRALSLMIHAATSFRVALGVGPIDVVMGTSPSIFQATSAWLISALRRCPFLLEIRDLWIDMGIELGVLRNRALIAALRALDRFLCRRARHIVVNSPAYRDYLIARGIPADKVTLIANGTDVTMFDPDARGEAIRQEFGLQGKFVAIYAGALGPANDVSIIVRAAARLQHHGDIHFLIVGDGMERASVERLADELHLRNVTFADVRPKREIPSFLAASDVCLATLRDIPMYRTTYPQKVFDYMAAGRPIALAIGGVIQDVVDAAGCGIDVPMGDDAALAEAVSTLYRDPERARAMGRAGRTHVAEHFDRSRQAQQFLELLERLVGTPAATAQDVPTAQPTGAAE
jgi:glycosyltransferase involved in cell wall biosynthesis